MGACGCGDYSPTYLLRTPRGPVYTLSFYTGCDYCDMPPGLVVTRMTRKEARETWDVMDLAEPDWQSFGRPGEDETDADAFIPIVSRRELKGLITDYLKAEDEMDEEDRHSPDDEGREWFVSDMMDEARMRPLWWPRPPYDREMETIKDDTPERARGRDG